MVFCEASAVWFAFSSSNWVVCILYIASDKIIQAVVNSSYWGEEAMLYCTGVAIVVYIHKCERTCLLFSPSRYVRRREVLINSNVSAILDQIDLIISLHQQNSYK